MTETLLGPGLDADDHKRGLDAGDYKRALAVHAAGVVVITARSGERRWG
ncbi:hypothetical protein GCM10027612_44190 [Microbispora bryophytorum subsp. camponoti]